MATTLKTRKPKGRSQPKIYEHTENIYSGGHKEPVATKEFVRQELKAEIGPVKESVDRLWKVMFWVSGGLLTVMIGGFALLLTVMIYLHSDTKQEMNRRFAEVNQKLDMLIRKQ